MEREEYIEHLYSKIKILNETLWEDRVRKGKVDDWLGNFNTDDEKFHALHLLSEFTYFGDIQVRHLLRSLYRDLYRYPIIETIRKANGNIIDPAVIEPLFVDLQRKTRFFGVGNPSESGAHLLYFFRQENRLSKQLFINANELIVRRPGGFALAFPDLEYYIFIDDFCGSGSQVTSDTGLAGTIYMIKELKPTAKVFYLMLMGTSTGITNVENAMITPPAGGAKKMFDHVGAVIEIDKTFRCFDTDSRYYSAKNPHSNKEQAKDMAYKYGLPLIKDIIGRDIPAGPDLDRLAHENALGFRDCQLLFGLHHNTPDNSLPIIWYDEKTTPWTPIFKRYNKKYSI